MKKTFTVVVITTLLSYASQAQRLVLMPQVGIETFRTDISSNNLFHRYKTYTSPSPTLGGRLMYFSKKGHGPYLGFRIGDLTTSSYDSISFYSRGITLYRFEAGYQWLSKPIYFKRIWDNHLSKEEFESLSKKGLAVQLMPSAGVVYTGGRVGTNTYSLNNTSYNENVYRGNLGLNAGLGLMFSNNGKQLFSLSVNYTKSFGSIYTSNFHSGNNSSYLTTKASGWNVSLGVPINLIRRK